MQKNIWNNTVSPRFRKFLVYLLLLGIVSSCKSKKIIVANSETTAKIATVASSKVLNDVKLHQLSFTTFGAKAKSTLSFNNDYYDASLTIRIRNKQAIWISVTTVFGIEAARVLITPDRFKLMNRLNGTFIDQPFNFIHRFSSPVITFADLQALFLGDPVHQVYSYTQTAEQNNAGYALNGQHDALSFHVQINSGYRPVYNELKIQDGNQQIRSRYTEFTGPEDQQLAQTVSISAITQKLTLDMQLKYNQITLNDPVEIPFNIPTKYKEIN